MATIVNNRKHSLSGLVVDGDREVRVTLVPGANDVPDDRWPQLQQSEQGKVWVQRGWVGLKPALTVEGGAELLPTQEEIDAAAEKAKLEAAAAEAARVEAEAADKAKAESEAAAAAAAAQTEDAGAESGDAAPAKSRGSRPKSG